MIQRFVGAGLLLLLPGLNVASAVTVPFVENFDSGPENWLNSANSALLDHVATGGVDDNGYVSTSFDLSSAAVDDTPVLARGGTSLLGPASEGAFFGDWIIDEAGAFSAQVRHNAPTPLTFFSRFASPINFPGAFGINFQPVFPNVWTEIRIDVREGNPQFVTFEGQDFQTVFSDVGNVQLGFQVPAALAGSNQSIQFDFDNLATHVPEPSAFMLASICMGFTGLVARRRRQRA